MEFNLLQASNGLGKKIALRASILLPPNMTDNDNFLMVTKKKQHKNNHVNCGREKKKTDVNITLRTVACYLLGAPSSCGWIITTFTVTDVRKRSIICSWVKVATATLQISTRRLPCLRPAFHAKPKGSTSATIPSKFTWNPSWPNPFLRRVISVVSHPLVTIYKEVPDC